MKKLISEKFIAYDGTEFNDIINCFNYEAIKIYTTNTFLSHIHLYDNKGVELCLPKQFKINTYLSDCMYILLKASYIQIIYNDSEELNIYYENINSMLICVLGYKYQLPKTITSLYYYDNNINKWIVAMDRYAENILFNDVYNKLIYNKEKE